MKKIGVIFGGVSVEHDVSVVSGLNVIKNLDKQKFNVKQIYIDKGGVWFELKEFVESSRVGEATEKVKKGLYKINNVLEYLKDFDIIFPVLHGKNGEDGTIQGLFEMIGKKYVGCKVLASSLGMDKVYAKIIFGKAGIPQAESIYIRKYKDNYIYVDKGFNEQILTLEGICDKICKNLEFPLFIKPSNSGSSVGINKAKNLDELKKHILTASKYDKKILIESEIKGRELECAVLGNEEVIASGVGEIITTEDFYSYEAKYEDSNTKTITKANIPQNVVERIQKLAIKAFKAIDGKGLARIDFFWNENTDIIYINEINTIPGFTEISMYAKLWKEAGIPYKELLERIIMLEEIS